MPHGAHTGPRKLNLLPLWPYGAQGTSHAPTAAIRAQGFGHAPQWLFGTQGIGYAPTVAMRTQWTAQHLSTISSPCTQADWSVNLGEHVVDLRVVTVAGCPSHILILGSQVC